MLTKIKRIRRKKYATGDVARDFKNIPDASKPQQGGLGTRNQNIDKYVTDQIKSPELASSARKILNSNFPSYSAKYSLK